MIQVLPRREGILDNPILQIAFQDWLNQQAQETQKQKDWENLVKAGYATRDISPQYEQKMIGQGLTSDVSKVPKQFLQYTLNTKNIPAGLNLETPLGKYALPQPQPFYLVNPTTGELKEISPNIGKAKVVSEKEPTKETPSEKKYNRELDFNASLKDWASGVVDDQTAYKMMSENFPEMQKQIDEYYFRRTGVFPIGKGKR
jgi:hypothetical protein